MYFIKEHIDEPILRPSTVCTSSMSRSHYKLEHAHRLRVRVHVFFEASPERGSILSNSVFFKILSLIIILAMLYLSYLYYLCLLGKESLIENRFLFV